MNESKLMDVAFSFAVSSPPLGPIPDDVSEEFMAVLLPYPFIRPVVMKRAAQYWGAGCPLDLCETAACRDVLQAL